MRTGRNDFGSLPLNFLHPETFSNMAASRKKDLPLHLIRRFLEPGPIVLVSSKWKDETNIMTMGWYTVMEFTPSLVGCVIAGGNRSFDLIRKSGQCVINLPTLDMAKTTVGIGNCSGGDIDKFEKFGLTAQKSSRVDAPSIKECFASFECILHDGRMIKDYNYFIFEVVKARVATAPKYPKTIHYRGDGIFMTSGNHINLKSKFISWNL